MRTGILFAVGVFALLSGCGSQGDKNIPVTPKWKGPAYRISFDTKAVKPNPAGITIPNITYTANPDALEMRAALVVRFDVSGGKKDAAVMNQMIMAPTDVKGAEGALAADYLDATDKELARYLGSYCLKGKVKISVALARSSLSPQASEGELETKRLSDWLPTEVDFKNPHKNPGC